MYLSCCHRLACSQPPSGMRLLTQTAGDASWTNSATGDNLDHLNWWGQSVSHGIACYRMNSMEFSPPSRRTSSRANPTLWAGLAASPMHWTWTSLDLTGSICASWRSRCLERSCPTSCRSVCLARWCTRWLSVCPRSVSSSARTWHCVGICALQRSRCNCRN